MFLPAVITLNAPAASIQKENRLQRMAYAMRLASGSNSAAAIKNMNARLGLSTDLAALGMTKNVIDTILSSAMASHLKTAKRRGHGWHQDC